MQRKQTIWRCDGCGKEYVHEADVNNWPRSWYVLAPLGDHVSGRHLCSKECVVTVAENITDKGGIPMGNVK